MKIGNQSVEQTLEKSLEQIKSGLFGLQSIAWDDRAFNSHLMALWRKAEWLANSIPHGTTK